MAWSKEWPKLTQEAEVLKGLIEEGGKIVVELIPKIYGIDLASEPSKTIICPSGRELKTQGSNLVDDQAYLYFQCEKCQSIFDPKTKSFATLNQKRHDAGWKVEWNIDGMGYKVYCVKCGKDEI